ncbi:hypothetical protein EV645_2270 [Kribbella rubisoli]|uniref:Uncharacterized protein n=1 Tax=Kribbella rubisoli TaxID=3075929 RepID=A0A4Q7XBP8_9ACTN|nr:hypothetical protein [Kribbella rubisoli]RZU20049.1 hypothetical protein EV645_2270 [Kribbella rubisoli]
MLNELSARVSVGVHLRPTTGLRVASFHRDTTGSPFVSMQIGDGAGEVAVMTHQLADLDRLGDLVAEARRSLASMLVDTAWERHDDPTAEDNPLDDDDADDFEDDENDDQASNPPGSRLLHAEGWI